MHYDSLIDAGNDPVYDPPVLREYMDKWDGRLFLDLLKLSPEKSVLEIGVGTGRIAFNTAHLVKSFYGIDISPKTIETAKKHLVRGDGNVHMICADFLDFGFSNQFDLIYSSLTFLHIKDKESAINKVFGLLFPGGRFVLSIDKDQKDTLDCGDYKIKIYPDDPENTAALLKSAGFESIKRYETEFAYIFSAEKPKN